MDIQYSTKAARRITWILFVAQSLGSAALIANSTLSPIVGADLSGQDPLAGLPGMVLLLGAASAAQPAGRFMQRVGRRRGLALGFGIGTLGMIVGGCAIGMRSFGLFLVSLLLIGVARGAVDQSRYAAADAQLPDKRARAISTVIFAGTIGAVAGPNLVGITGDLMSSVSAAPLAGSMWVGALLFGLAGLLIAGFLRPDPRDLARLFAAADGSTPQPNGPARPLREIFRLPAAQLALAAMVFGQVVMVLIMSVTSLHMHHHQHSLEGVGTVIMAHTLGMFGLSVLTGPLADRIGRPLTIGGGALLLFAGSLLAPISLRTESLAAALFLLGLGWNLCYIAGSALLADILAPAERGQAQGATELVVNLASGASSLCSGFILASLGFSTLGPVGAALALVPLALLVWRLVIPARVAAREA